MSRRLTIVALASVAAVLAASACTADKDAPAPAVSAAPAPAYRPETRMVVVRAGRIFEMRVEPLIRKGTTVVLSISTRLPDSTAESAGTNFTGDFSGLRSSNFDASRVIDEHAGRVWHTARVKPGGKCVCTTIHSLKPGETRPLQAAFMGVPENVTSLTVMLPYAGVFTDVPIVAGEVPVPPAYGQTGSRIQEPLDLSVGASESAALETYVERPDVAMSTHATPTQVDISLDADVLFKVDSAELTPAAASSITAAVTDVTRAGPGALAVTGHTDNSGTTKHNQTLSEQRAKTVATALTAQLPDAEWPKTVTGKGETEPEVANTSATNRRLNRRVTISYRTQAAPASASPAPGSPAPASPAPGPATDTALPATKGVVGAAPDGVTVKLPTTKRRVTLVPKSVSVRGPYLLISMAARNTDTDDAHLWNYLGSGIRTARGEFDPFSNYGAAGVRLLEGSTAYYGVDYELESGGGHQCLCDRSVHSTIPPGSERVISMWFPRPAGSSTTITLDVADKFRITDIPIS